MRSSLILGGVLAVLLAMLAVSCSARGTAAGTAAEPTPASAEARDDVTATPTSGQASIPVATHEPDTEEGSMTPEPGSEAQEGAAGSSAERVVELARQDLAEGLGVDPQAIEVVSVEKVEWRDTSLGCPEPGMMYAQVITPGYRVVLQVEGETYEYHTGESRSAVACGQAALGDCPMMLVFAHGKGQRGPCQPDDP
jgi:hypothetical protein